MRPTPSNLRWRTLEEALTIIQQLVARIGELEALVQWLRRQTGPA